MNTHESYVSLETAKLLKEAGFDWPTRYSYDLYLYSTEGEKRVIDGFASTFCNEHNGLASMPTLDVAQRWLREVKGYNVLVCHNFKWNKHGWWILQDNDMLCHNHEIQFDTYEQALEEGIKNCLTILLEENK